MQSKFNNALTHYKNGQLNKAKDICIEILKIDIMLHPNNLLSGRKMLYLK